MYDVSMTVKYTVHINDDGEFDVATRSRQARGEHVQVKAVLLAEQKPE